MNKLFFAVTLILFTSGFSDNNFYVKIKEGKGYTYSEIFTTPQSKNSKKKLKKPLSVKRAQKIQAKKEKQQKRESEKFLDNNRKRSLEIQTPEVRERMKQNVKDANANSKSKRKTNSSRAKKAKSKYK